MTANKFFRVLAIASALALSFTSCKKDPVEPQKELGTIQAVVQAEDATPIVDATVTIDNTSLSAVTAADGSFSIQNVPIDKQILTVKKANFADLTVPVMPTAFVDKVADLGTIYMVISGAVIQGLCVDAEGLPLQGVEAILDGGAAKMTTAADGIYKFENLTLKDYTILLKKADCVDITLNVTADMFKAENNYLVEMPDSKLGAPEILPGRTADDLAKLDVWHYNEYRGGKNGDDYPHFDWSSDFMGTFTGFYGWWEEQNEGTTLQIQNSADQGHQNRPADLENFDSYLAGRKKITADNCKMYVKVRTHGADAANPAMFGVMVVDLNAAKPVAERIGDIRSYGNDSYTNPDFEFDLSAYIDKEVVIAIGIYRAQTGDYWKQVCLRRIAFAKEAPSEWGYLPGKLVSSLNAGYKMTEEMVCSTMPIEGVSEFIGISPVGRVDVDGPEMYREAYKTWRNANHFAAWWSCMPVKKDSEPFAGEGFVIKTNGGGTPVSLNDPQSYFYAKFAIAEGHNQLTLNCRNFSSTNPTYFKVTAITELCEVIHLNPAADHGASSAEPVSDGAWKFIHESGSGESPEDYAHFKYDLSQFNGKNVIIALAVFKGEDNGDENKLSIHSITIK